MTNFQNVMTFLIEFSIQMAFAVTPSVETFHSGTVLICTAYSKFLPSNGLAFWRHVGTRIDINWWDYTGRGGKPAFTGLAFSRVRIFFDSTKPE